MKYAVVKVENASYTIYSQSWTDLSKAKVSFHGLCQTLWNTKTVLSGAVMIVDENLDCVEGYKEVIYHEAPEPEPVIETTDATGETEGE